VRRTYDVIRDTYTHVIRDMYIGRHLYVRRTYTHTHVIRDTYTYRSTFICATHL